MMASRNLGPQLIDSETIPDYPLPPDMRLTTHFFITWHHDRWLNSRFRLSSPPEVRGLALDLYCLSQKQTPVGTLPDDDVQLAALLMLDLGTWQSFRRRDWSPLYGWEKCNCDGEVRWMHPVVLEMIADGMKRRDKHREDNARGLQRKRLERLPDQVRSAGGTKAMTTDMDLLEWVDGWLMHHCTGNRTKEWVRRALEAHSLATAQVSDA